MTDDPKSSETSDDGAPFGSVLGRHEAAALGILIFCAALFRVLRWSATAVMFNDGPVFIGVAEAMAAGEWARALNHEYHPLFPALIAAVHSLIGDWELAGVVVSVIGGTAAVACLYGFVRAAFGRTTAFVAAAILAVHPYVIKFSGDVQSEGLYLGLFLGAVWALWLALRNASLRAASVAGLLCGLAYLTRPEGIGLLVVGGALAAWQALRGSWSRRRLVAWGALLFLSTALVGGPYVAWIRADSGVWSLTQKKSVGWVTGLSGPPARYAREEAAVPPEPERAVVPPSTTAQTTEQAPQRSEEAPEPSPVARGISRYADALVDLAHSNLQALGPELFVILLAGGLIGRWRKLSLRGLFVLGVVGLYGLVLFELTLNVGYVSTRHALPPVTVALGHVAAALLAVAGVFSGSKSKVALALILIALTGVGLLRSLRPDRTDSVAERRAAEWLRAENLPPGGVAVHRRRIAYYAGAPAVKIPDKPPKNVIVKMRKWGAEYLIVSDEDIADYPWLAKALPERAQLLHREEANGVTAFVYRLLRKRKPIPTVEPLRP
jgi:4-amino-4-deoxy-L-arabinose transferase-like glycosyltransferase